MRVLVTGITGFVGHHLAAELHARHPDAETWGLAWGPYDRATLEALSPGIRLVEGDLVDTASLAELLGRAQPDAIYHLAAASSVARSWAAAPVKTMSGWVLSASATLPK